MFAIPLAPSENWDDDFEFQKSTPKANNANPRMSFASSDWDHDDLANDLPMTILGDKKNTIPDTPSRRSRSVDIPHSRSTTEN